MTGEIEGQNRANWAGSNEQRMKKNQEPSMNELPYPNCKPGCRYAGGPGNCRYREQHIPIVAVDFDRVLFHHESWEGHEHVGEPIIGAARALHAIRGMGFKIMIWTTRAQKEIISAACNSAGIPFDFINENPNQPPEINPSKPVADFYIDDRALHFISWDQVLEEIKYRKVHDGYYPLKDQHHDMSDSIGKRVCVCGNDTFRIIETADFLPAEGVWEGNETFRICARCGRRISCFNGCGMIGIDAVELAKLENPEGK